MYANYHTHTVRCNHASGSERDYIEQAIRRGVKVLGFSDHSPQIFDEGYVSGFRMLPEQFENYVTTLRSLQKEYEGKIRILIGLEAEYYPRYFDRLIDFVRPYHLDFMIMGQHFLDNEHDTHIPSSCETEDEEILKAYVEQVTEGLRTGFFTYIAHPDVLHFTGDSRTYEKWMGQLCENCKHMNIPLEINLLGMIENRHYPSLNFFSLAQKIGNDIVLGSDAHEPDRVAHPQELKQADRFMQEAGIVRYAESLRTIEIK